MRVWNRKTSRRRAAAVAATVALTAAACGGGDPAGDGSETAGSEAASEAGSETATAATGTEAADCDPEGATLKVTYPGRLGPTLPTAAEAVEAEFDGLSVEMSDSATSYVDTVQQVVADESAGMVPDVVLASTGQIAFYTDALGARELDPDALPDTYDERFLEAGVVDGALHGVPLHVSIPLVIWNKDVFEQAGLDADTPPETNSEVIEFAEQIKAEVPDVSPAFYPSTIVYDWFFQNMLMSAGGEMVDDQGNPTFATPEGVTALEPWAQLNARDLHAPATGLDGIEIFTAGDIGFVLATNSVLATIDGGIGDGFEWGVAPAPVADDGERRFAAGGNALVVLAQDDCQSAWAEAFVAAALSPETQAQVAEATGYIPVDTEAVEMLADFYDDNPQYAVPVEYDGALEPWIAFPGERGFEASEEFRTLLESVSSGADPEQALEETQTNVEAILGG